MFISDVSAIQGHPNFPKSLILAPIVLHGNLGPILHRFGDGDSDRRPETKQGIEGKIVRFRSGRVRDRVRVRDKDRRSEAINFGAC